MNVSALKSLPWPVYAAAGVVAFFVVNKLTGGGIARAIGSAVAGGAVEAAKGAAEGVTLGIGDAIGVPRTDTDKCAAALAEGRTWDASFVCPAADFIKGVGRKFTGDPTPTEAVGVPRPTDKQLVYGIY